MEKHSVTLFEQTSVFLQDFHSLYWISLHFIPFHITETSGICQRSSGKWFNLNSYCIELVKKWSSFLLELSTFILGIFNSEISHYVNLFWVNTTSKYNLGTLLKSLSLNIIKKWIGEDCSCWKWSRLTDLLIDWLHCQRLVVNW